MVAMNMTERERVLSIAEWSCANKGRDVVIADRR
jgi:hypothetical protein